MQRYDDIKDEQYMMEALGEAQKAEECEEVPIGAVVVYNNKIIARGYNLREKKQLSTSHAEMIAIQEACREIGSWRLEECTLYVTLEPCPMCAGAIVQSRIRRVVYGAADPKAGCCGTLMNLLDEPRFNHQVPVTSGVLEEKCSEILKQFFKKIRRKKKENQNEASGSAIIE
ncbi:tRNA adenosine(34) deaminase TadA [Evansella sp. AB-P1]|uniref:tRNA adenosine(34) deaminase TadA n=1 Tax=Evansella sp. AB-P1 TaxID=3037653 RepID=UPI00241CFEF1|nr:tRNA adenosine(34) deaminase TadA [Evansella sp. AB-P1]MDG5790112.1 tRNA adenosine(34) deaminase TadA [Evansella sp. AB-P1]